MLKEVIDILEPFAETTNFAQGYSVIIGYVAPAILISF